MFNYLFYLIFIFLTAVNCNPKSDSNSGGSANGTREENNGGRGKNNGGSEENNGGRPDGNNNDSALIATYNQKFENYLTGFNEPTDPPKWELAKEVFTASDGTAAKRRYKISEDIENYIDQILAELSKAKVNEDLIVKDMSSKPGNKVLILKDTDTIKNLEKSVFKTGPEMRKRIAATNAAHIFIENLLLTSLYGPKFAAPYNESYLLEELIDLNSSHEYQEELYTTLFEKAQNKPELKTKVIKLISDITKLACKAKIDDIKYDNFPLSPLGKVIILDPEQGGGDIMRLLNSQTSEFYIPGAYIQTVIDTAKSEPTNFCKKIEEADPQTINDAKLKGDARHAFIKGFKEFKAKKRIITGKETFSDQDIAKAQALFTDAKDKYFAKVILDVLNTGNYYSRVVPFGKISNSLSFGTASQIVKDKYKELGITYVNYFGKPANNTKSSAYKVFLTLKDNGFFYSFGNEDVESFIIADIKTIYF